MNAKIKAIEVCVCCAFQDALTSSCWEVELPNAVERGAGADISRPRGGASGSE
jgi:hypothetical protein